MTNANPDGHRRAATWIAFTLFPLLATATIELITTTQFIAGDQTLVSAGQEFELGFFAGKSNNWYVGIWYKKTGEKTIAWVANRDSPVRNSPGILKISSDDGNLILLDGSGKTVWSMNSSATSQNTVAELLDNGNLVLRRENDDSSENYLWQSFDHPTDTLLPGMKLGWDSKTGLHRYLTSWKSLDDPSSGDYNFRLNIQGYPELYLMQREKTIYRTGPWNGLRFSGVADMKSNPCFSMLFVMNPDEVSYSFNLKNKSVYSRLVVAPDSYLKRFTWIPSRRAWTSYWNNPQDQCDNYRDCGVYGMCDMNASPICECLRGFVPRNPQAWNLRDWFDGCVRVRELHCPTDGFLKLTNVKLPESGVAFVNKEMGLDRCRELCRQNCSCRGYSNANISDGGSGCVIWAEDLYDMREFAAVQGGQDFFARVAAADLEQKETVGSSDDPSKTKPVIKVVAITVGGIGGLLVGSAIFFIWRREKSTSRLIRNTSDLSGSRKRGEAVLLTAATILSNTDHQSGETAAEELDLPLLDLDTLVIATDKFSDANKLGMGGFGSVYKGLLGGQEVAVKRLSKNSGQGVEEFKNEVKLIARLQHRNLVRLLGCCVESEEKMLVYEYMENKSLDLILFRKGKSTMLNWERRINIIRGIARGLVYLHHDSRIRIIHRDLKASNILLDKEMNPKISDFGMARMFRGDQIQAETERVVGTHGYMAPEYAMDGLFSTKSDMFSFGVLVLEIVSGKKNRGFYQTNNQLNLLAYAWKLYRKGRTLELLDPAAGESYPASEVMRCIQVGLLCVQEQAEDRPTMSTVVLMLSSDCVSMPQPKNPGYCLGRHQAETNSSSTKLDESCTVNLVTVTMIDGR